MREARGVDVGREPGLAGQSEASNDSSPSPSALTLPPQGGKVNPSEAIDAMTLWQWFLESLRKRQPVPVPVAVRVDPRSQPRRRAR